MPLGTLRGRFSVDELGHALGKLLAACPWNGPANPDFDCTRLVAGTACPHRRMSHCGTIMVPLLESLARALFLTKYAALASGQNLVLVLTPPRSPGLPHEVGPATGVDIEGRFGKRRGMVSGGLTSP